MGISVIALKSKLHLTPSQWLQKSNMPLHLGVGLSFCYLKFITFFCQTFKNRNKMKFLAIHRIGVGLYYGIWAQFITHNAHIRVGGRLWQLGNISTNQNSSAHKIVHCLISEKTSRVMRKLSDTWNLVKTIRTNIYSQSLMSCLGSSFYWRKDFILKFRTTSIHC